MEWVKANEQKPRQQQRVLVWHANWPANSDQPYTAVYDNLIGWADVRRGKISPGVTHWMPLPEPPKE